MQWRTTPSAGGPQKAAVPRVTRSRATVPHGITRSRRKPRRTAMQHVAIDLGGRESQFAFVHGVGRCRGRRVFPRRCRGPRPAGKPGDPGDLGGGVPRRRRGDRSAEVRVVPATLVRQLGVGPELKTDLRDARALSERHAGSIALGAHPVGAVAAAQSQCGSRELLIAMRTMTVNSVRGWMRTQLFRSEAAAQPVSRRVFARWRRRRGSPADAVEMSLGTIEHLTGQIKLADKALCEFAKTTRCVVGS